MASFHERHLPHYHVVDHPVFLTWRLHGSLPASRVFPGKLTSGQAFVTMDNLLHRVVTGPVHLKNPQIAALVCDALLYRETTLRHCALHAWVVMPNHVHVLLTPAIEISQLTQSLKRYTALESNRILCRSGPFWQEESYDRVVRNQEEFGRLQRYILMNPVKAGLVNEPADYPWSSANRRWSR